MDVPLKICTDISTVDYGKLSVRFLNNITLQACVLPCFVCMAGMASHLSQTLAFRVCMLVLVSPAPVENTGELKVLSTRLTWRKKHTDRMIVMKIGEIREVKWMAVPRSIQFSFFLEDGRSYRFYGFTKDDQAYLTEHFKSYEIPTQEEECIVSGKNSTPLVLIRGNMLSFELKQHNIIYEIPLTHVTSIETIGANDVQVNFHIDNTIGAFNSTPEMDILEYVKLGIPDTSDQFGGIVDSTPAIAFKEWINSFDCVRLGSDGVPIATFERLIFVNPMGVYNMDFNLQFFGLRRNQIFVTILYRSIVSIHVLPKPDLQFVEVVICVDPPLEIGSQKYAYIVLQFNSDVKLKEGVELHMSDELYTSRFISKLQRSYTVEDDLLQYEVVVRMLEGLSNIKRSDTDGYGYGLNTTSESNRKGVLYPLEDAFYYLPNPPSRILYDDIKYIEIKCPEEGLFDLHAVLNTASKRGVVQSSNQNFNNLPRDELGRLADFLKSKGLEIRGYEDPSSSYGSFTESAGFRYFSKSMKEEMEKEFSGLASQAIRLKMINRWMELPDEMKDFYEIMGQGTRG
uniref:FACT complex subunit SSRP1 n=1 Tax=Tanacetum cinerariifolium TaxID=118510 RepID=A0A6L2KBM4_TANCI|nr:FACT complex subunit SSRP1 [Tanacetum cinerariifolium]